MQKQGFIHDYVCLVAAGGKECEVSMQVGIIDDDVQFINMFREKLYPQIIKFSNDDENNLISSTEMLSSEVLNALDIIFFDIQLQDKNSIDLIAEVESEFNAKIVFLSSQNDLVFDALRVKPLSFIRKSNLEEDFRFFVELYSNDIIKRRTVKLTNEHGHSEKIYTDQILYITACGHDISITTMDRSFIFISSLKKVMNELNDKRFIQIQKSTCVNMKHIVEMQKEKVIMRNGSAISISRFFRQNTREKYLDYLLDEPI